MEIAPIDPVPANAVLDQAAARPAALEPLAQRFGELLQQAPDQAAHAPPAGPNVISSYMAQQEHALKKTVADVRDLAVRAPYMGIEEVTARHMELTWQMAMVQLQFNAGVYVSQSSKNGLQTLMKNQ